MVTCSSIGPAIPVARSTFDFPIFRVDEAMAERAVKLGTKIGVAATLKTTLEPTVGLIQEKAAAADRNVEVQACLCDGAFERVLAGDTETHDRIVSDALSSLAREVDAIVLAQASMARGNFSHKPCGFPFCPARNWLCSRPGTSFVPLGRFVLRKRTGVLLLLITLTVITFLDRLCIAVAATQMQDDLGFPRNVGVGC